MRLLDVVRLRIRSLLGRPHMDADLDRELRDHLDREVDDLVGRGLDRQEARRVALSTFGGVQRVREESRDARGTAVFENLMRDLRYAFRGLQREPMLLVAATMSIALGAGGNLAVFSLARAFVFPRPDVRQSDTLIRMQVSHGSHVSYRRYNDLVASDALAAFAGYAMEKQVNWLNGDAAVSVLPMVVTANYFDVTGVPMALGRPFTAVEARAEDDPHVVVVSHTFWRNRLGGDSSVVGRPLVLNGESYTILGVLAPRLTTIAGFSVSPGLYVPLSRRIVPELDADDANVVQLVGRLKPTQTLEQGRAAVDAADRRLGRLVGDTLYAGVQEFAPVGTLAGPKATRVVGAFFVLLGVVSLLVLLIACANVAGLLIARSTRRRQEIAIRLAIGGTRFRLVQQHLVEGFWLAVLGTLAGLGLCLAFMRVLNGVTLPIPLPVELNLQPDWMTVGLAVALVVVTIVFCSVLPALSATRLALVPALKREEPFYATRRVTTRSVLLVGQVMVSTVLLVTAFLFVRNLTRSQVTDPGFSVDRALFAQLGLVEGRSQAEQVAFLQRAVERLESIPDVERAAFSAAIPLTVYGGSSNGRTARVDGGEGHHIEFSRLAVGPNYFTTMGVRVLGGREFVTRDGPGAPRVAIVNAEFARKAFGDRDPIGHRVAFTDDETASYEVIGVVANGKYQTLGEAQRPAFFIPLMQEQGTLNVAFVVAKVRADERRLVSPVRQALGELDRSVSVDVQPMRNALAFALLPSRIGAAVLGSLGILGLVLAAFGLYALVSYTASRRVGEIAIRSALGASRGGIVRLVIGDAALFVGLGVVAGLAVSALVTAPLSRFLVTGLSATDPLSYGGTLIAFLLVGLLASWLPVRSATRVSPAVAMRLD